MARVAGLNKMRKTGCFVQYAADGTRHVFSSEAAASEFAAECKRQKLYAKLHTEAQRQADQAAGSLAALVCSPEWRLSREL